MTPNNLKTGSNKYNWTSQYFKCPILLSIFI